MSWDDPAFDKYRAPGASPLEGFGDSLSRKVGLDPYYTKLLLERESGHLSPSAQTTALSSAGAMGPMQVMPETGAAMAKKYGIDFNTPSGQMEAGIRYYKELHDRFGDPATAAAAYHSGPTRVAEIVGRKGDLSTELGPVGRDYYKWFKNQLAQRQPLAPPPAAQTLVPPPSAVGMPREEPSAIAEGLRGVGDIAEKTFELPGIKQFHEAAGAQKGALEKYVLGPTLGYGEGETLGGQIQKGALALEEETPALLKPVVGFGAGVVGAVVDIATDPLVWELGLVGSALGPGGAAAGGAVGALAKILRYAPRLAKGLGTGQKIAHVGFMTGMVQHAATDIPRGLAGVIENPDQIDPWMKLGGGSVSGFMVAHGLTRKTPVQEGRVKFSTEDEAGNLVPIDPAQANKLLQNPGIRQVAELEDLSVSSLWQMLKESRDVPDTPLPEMHLLFGSKSRAMSEATPGGGRLGLDIGHLMADAAALPKGTTPEQRSVFLANWIYRASKHEIDHLLLEGGVDHTLPIEFRREAGELARKAYGETDSILNRPGDIPMMSYEEYAVRLKQLAEKHGVQLDTSTEAYNRIAAESEVKIGNGGVAAIMAKMLRHPDPVGFVDRFKANPREAWKELPFNNIEPLWQNLVGELGGLTSIFPAAYMEQISQGLTRPPGELLGRMGGTVVPVPKMGANVPKVGTPTLGPPPMLAEGEFGKGGKPGSKKGRRGFFATTEPRTSAAIPETVLKAGAEHPEYAADQPFGAEVAGGIPTRPVERGVVGGDLTPILPTRPETAAKGRTEVEKQRLLNQIARQRKMKAEGEFQGPPKRIELKDKDEMIVPLAPTGTPKRESQERLAKSGLGEIIINDRVRGTGTFRIQPRKMKAEGEFEDEAYIASKMEPDRADELVTLAKAYAKERPVKVDADKQFWVDSENERRAALAARGTFSDVTGKYMKAEGEEAEVVYTGRRGAPKGTKYRRRGDLDEEPTGREKQILERTAEGKTARQISEDLGLSFFTVRNHMVHMRERAEASSMGEMIKFAREKGWIGKGKEAALPEKLEKIRDLVSAGLKDSEIAEELGTSRTSVRRQLLDTKELLGVKGKRGSLMRAEGEDDQIRRMGPKIPVAGGKYFRAAELQGPPSADRKEVTGRNISSDKAPRLITPEGRVRSPLFNPPPKPKVIRGPRKGGIDDAMKEAIAALEAQGKDVSRFIKPPPKMEAAGEGKKIPMPPVDFGKILEGAEKIKAEKSNASKLRGILGKGLADFQKKRLGEIDTRTAELRAEREELKARAPEVVVPAIKKMKAEGEDFEKFQTGTGEAFKRMFMQRIYGGTSPGKTWAKEATQNILDAFDDIRDNDPNFKGKASLGFDSTTRTLTSVDNGVGMSPEFMKEHFLNPGDSGKRGKDRRGNFGIAKLALFGIGDPFEVKTVWQSPEGKKFETRVRGVGTDWITRSEAEISRPKEVSAETPTGTDIKVTLDKDIAGFGDEGLKTHDFEDYLMKTLSRRGIEDAFSVQIDGKDQAIKKGASWSRPYATEGGVVRPGQWGTGLAKHNEETIERGEATYEISWKPSTYERSAVNVTLLNRGQLQSEAHENNMTVNLMESIKGLPENVEINVKAKVPATHKDYPWEFDRKNLKEGPKKVVEQWLQDKISTGRKETGNKYMKLEEEAPQIGSSQIKLFTPSTEFSYGEAGLKERTRILDIVADPFTQILAEAWVNGAKKYLKAVAPRTKAKYHLGWSAEWLGLNAPGGWYPDKANRIFLNPWLHLTKVMNGERVQELISRDPQLENTIPTKLPADFLAKHADAIATEMMASSVHEITHNLQRGHGEDYAGALTSAMAEGFVIGSKTWKPLAAILKNPEMMEKLRGQAAFFETLQRSYDSPFTGAVSRAVPEGRAGGLRGEETGPGTAEAGGALSKKVMRASAEELQEMATSLRPDILKALRSRLRSHLKGTPWEDLGIEGIRSVKTPLPPKISEVMTKLNDLGATAEEVDRVEGFAKYDPLWEKLGAPRAVITSLDLSGILRQGVVGTARMAFENPGALASAIRKSVTALASESEFKKSMESVESSVDFDFLKGLGVDFAKGEEQFGGARFVDGVFKKVTGGKLNFVRASERAYTYYLNRLRYELGKHHLDSLRKLGFESEYTVDAESGRATISGTDAPVYRRMASWINIATGRGQLPQGKGQFQTAVRSADKFLNMVFFSPRLMLARLAMLYPGTYTGAFMEMAKSKGVGKATRGMMALHMGDMVAYSALVAGTMSALSAAFPDAEIEGDMTSSDFGQVRMGNTRVDASGGLRTYITTAARVLSGETTTEYGVVKPQQARETILKFFQGKLGPLPGLALTLAEGQNLVGDPAYGPLKDVLTGNEKITPEVLQEILKVTGGTLSQQTVTPMIISDMQRLLSQNDFSPIQVAMLMSLMTVGSGVSTREAQEGLSPKSQEALRGTKVEPMGRPTTVNTPFKDALGRAIELKLPYMAQRHLEEHSDKTFYEILDRVVKQSSFQRMPPAAQRMVVVQLLADARSARSPQALQTLGASRFLPMVEKKRYPEDISRLLPPPPGFERKKRWTDIGDWVE